MNRKQSAKCNAAIKDGEIADFLKAMLKVLARLRVDRPETWSDKLAGISRMELHILLLVQARPDIILREVRDDLDIPNSTLTGIIDRLEKSGLIERTINPRDRRSFGLMLTPEGKEIRKEHDRVMVEVASKVLCTLDTEEERRTLTGLLSTVGSRLE